MTLTLLLLAFVTLIIACSLFYTIRFTRQKVIDTFGLNRLLNVKNASQLSYTELKRRVAEIAWKRMKPAPEVILRNGWAIKEITPMNAMPGFKYMVVARDNRPANNRCHILFTCNMIGTVVTPTITIQDNRDYEYMVYLLGMGEKKAQAQLKSINAGDEGMKQNVEDRYTMLAMREIL